MRCLTPRFAMPTFKRSLVAALLIAALPAAAFAEHFYIIHPSALVPSAESLLFCAPCVGELDSYSETPTVEEYLIDQLFD